MKRCAAKPYEGQEKYIFVSYCHKDRAYVFPIIEQLTKDGYRVWYDEGIDPGSEWPEIIASHLNSSAICLAFISEKSINSHNCRREINFALLKRKYFISVILEPVEMPLGMEMQLSSSQSIFKYELSSDKAFFAKLYEAEELEKCKGQQNYSIVVSTPNDYLDESNSCEKVRDPFSDSWFAQNNDEAAKAEADRKAAEEAERERRRQEEIRKAAEKAEADRKAAEEAERERLRQEKIRQAAEEAERERQRNEAMLSMHLLKRKKTGEVINISKPVFKVGRSMTSDDYVISDNRSISRGHATFMIRNDICYVIDNHSLNKTFVNGMVVAPETENVLKNGDNVRLYNERFTYLKYQN